MMLPHPVAIIQMPVIAKMARKITTTIPKPHSPMRWVRKARTMTTTGAMNQTAPSALR